MKWADKILSCLLVAVSLLIVLLCPVLIFAADGGNAGGLPLGALISGITGMGGIALGWVGAIGKYGRAIKEGLEAYKAVMRTVVSAQTLIKSAPQELANYIEYQDFVADMDNATNELADVMAAIGKDHVAIWLRDLIREKDLTSVKNRLLSSNDPVLSAAREVFAKK